MAFEVYFEDGKGNAMDEDGLEPVQMEVDDITNYDSHMDLKPSEKKKLNLKLLRRPQSLEMEVNKVSRIYTVEMISKGCSFSTFTRKA